MKREAGVWPRLTESASQRLPWLRTDFDRLSAPVLKAMLAAGGSGGDDDAEESSDGEWKPRANVNVIRPSPEEIVSQIFIHELCSKEFPSLLVNLLI